MLDRPLLVRQLLADRDLPASAGLLLAALADRPRRLRELRAMGFTRAKLGAAVKELAGRGICLRARRVAAVGA